MPFPPTAVVLRGRAYVPPGTFVGAVCAVCGVETDADELVKSRAAADGHERTCLRCHRQRNAESVPTAQARYRSRTPAEVDAAWDRLRPDGLKRCTRCHERKPKAAYAANRSTPDGRSSECRTCTALTQAARRRK